MLGDMKTRRNQPNKLLAQAFRPQTGGMLAALGLAVMVGGLYLQADASSSAGCLDGSKYYNFRTSFTRGTGTISTANGQPLCADTKLVLESFSMPDTWNNQGFNQSAIPQYKFGVTSLTFPGGQSNVSKTATVPVPADCKNTQLDFYYPPAFESISGLTDDDARYIGGRIFGKTQSNCNMPTPTPSPNPTPSPTTLPASITPAPPTPTPSPTPQITVACLDLKASVTSGNAPLSVTFTGRGQAAGQSIGQYQFDFGNNDGVTGSSSVVNYTYSQPGTYKATLKVKGSLSGQSGETDACTVTIQVTGTSNQPSVTPTPKPQLYLPQTGVTGPLMTFVGALLITGGLLHVWLTSRNKLLIVPKRR